MAPVHPEQRTRDATPPTRISSDDFTSRPTRNSRNMTSEFGESRQYVIWPNPSKDARADKNACQNLAHYGGLMHPLEDLPISLALPKIMSIASGTSARVTGIGEERKRQHHCACRAH